MWAFSYRAVALLNNSSPNIVNETNDMIRRKAARIQVLRTTSYYTTPTGSFRRPAPITYIPLKQSVMDDGGWVRRRGRRIRGGLYA